VAALTLQNITKRYGETTVLNGVNLTVSAGEFLVLVGPSGCGKSSVLRLVAGLEEVTHGQILLDNHPITHLSPKDRNVAMVFQNYALYPHLTVAENMEFGLKRARLPAATRQSRIEAVSHLLGLDGLLGRKPKALSGGQRQRVALGRAIVRDPKLFLFDEPLSNLDAELRVSMRAEIARLQRRLHTTTLYVTHDQVEAMTLGHRIAVLAPITATNALNVQQIGTPREIYDTPANTFVAKFLGSPAMNLFPVHLKPQGGFVAQPGLTVEWPQATPFPSPLTGLDDCILGIRPEHLHAARADDSAQLRLRVEMIELVGSEMLVYGHTESSHPVVARLPVSDHWRENHVLELSASLQHLHYFHPRHLGRVW